MARRHVSYEEAARPGAAGHRVEVDLGPPGRSAPTEDPQPGRGSTGPWLVVAAVALAVVAWGGWSPPPPEARPAPSPAVRTSLPEGGAIGIRARDVLPAPWRGVFEHHPRAPGADAVARVHAVALAHESDDHRRALLVVDATRRAFSGPERGWRSDGAPVRVLGAAAGTGLRTRQWDDGGYGVSLTAVGFTWAEHERLAAAVEVPEGESLSSGRAPSIDAPALAELRLVEADRRSGPGTTVGSHLIGQTGRASIDGLVHRADGVTVLISAVEDQLVSAAFVRRALGDVADLPTGHGTTATALVGHVDVPRLEGRIRGWVRVLLDHPAGVTVELASDALGVGALPDVAAELDVDELVRRVAPAA